MSSGCGCKEVYAYPHTTYPYSSCICSFWQQHPYSFVHFCKCFSFLFLSFFVFLIFGKYFLFLFLFFFVIYVNFCAI